jgi:zinc transporter ZupT
MSRRGLSVWLWALVPVGLLILALYSLVSVGPRKLFDASMPAVESLHVMRHHLATDRIRLDVMNAGADDSTIAQVMVRGAFWNHSVEPLRTLPPLSSARVEIPYPWNHGEPVAITLLTASGLTFDYEIEVATTTPTANLPTLARFALLGAIVGLFPVILGMTWFPLLRRLGSSGMSAVLFFTLGLLAFLAIDTLSEGWELAQELPGIFQGVPLLALGTIGALLSLFGVENIRRTRKNSSSDGAAIAWVLALGIGLHNLGEGLAIGSAYVLGELSLGLMLIVGFTLHNATEGIAIVAPLVDEGATLSRLLRLGLLAGAPTILGTWIGAFVYSPVWTILFLGLGAGAILQVLLSLLGSRRSAMFQPSNVIGFLLGFALMIGTGLLVGAA